ncbi:hypothetical protein F5890DRAFT_1560752 [Lentinula detonsa]|uniref:Uncharacterized protein n=1 Tax=Lentinula detonsa TaxID=2804962 RepID=A0AA38PMC8_9AGAR|nr:hypothetical protein F5890DRAFT_1560752 [Lentinula detonsa]
MSSTTHQLATSDDLNGSEFHAVIDTDVFTCLSHKHHDFPRVPSRSDTLNPSPNVPMLPDFSTPRWVTASLPFLGFAPSSNPFKFYFLKCLDYAFHTLPIERISENRYTLKQSLKTDWDSLERNMRAFLRGCMKSGERRWMRAEQRCAPVKHSFLSSPVSLSIFDCSII